MSAGDTSTPGRGLSGRAAPTLMLLALGLPGQATQGVVRLWVTAGALPLLHARGLSPTGADVRRLWPWLALLGAVLVLAPASPRPGAGLWLALLIWSWIAAVFLGLALSREGGAVARLAPWIGAAGGLAALCGLTPWLWRVGAFGNPNFLASFLSLTVIWTAAWLRDEPRDVFHVWAWSLLVLQLIALVFIDSIGAWAAVLVGLVALTAHGLWRGGRRGWLAFLLVVGLMAGVAGSQSGAVREHLKGRLFMARVCVQVVAEHPAGVGPGAFPGAWMEAQAARLEAHPGERLLWTRAHHAHNEALQVAVELGWWGLLLWALPIVAGLRAASCGVGWASVWAVLCLGCVSLPLYEPSTAALFGLGLGLCLGGGARGEGGRVWRRIFVAAAGAAALVASADLVSDRMLRRGAEAGDPDGLGAAVTLGLRPEHAMRQLAVALRPRDLEGALSWAERATARDPSPTGWAQVGELRAGLGRRAEAIEAYERAVRLQMGFFTGHVNLAILLERRGELTRARRHALRATSLRPDDPRLLLLPAVTRPETN